MQRWVIGSPGKQSVLRNVSPTEINAFLGQADLIDLIGYESLAIDNDWVTELSYGDCLGRELNKAEFSLKHGFKFLKNGS